MIPGITAQAMAGAGSMSDPYWTSTVFLLQPAGPNGSTAFVDKAKGRTITAQGNAQMDTGTTKFSPAALKTDGAGDAIRCADSADWLFGQQFTIETFLRMATAPAHMAIMGQWGSSGANNTWFLYVEAGVLRFRFQNTIGLLRDADYTWSTRTTGVWYHVAATRDASNVLRLFIDGAVVRSVTQADSFNNGNGAFSVGDLPGFPGTFDANCHFDQVRITNGVCRYNSAFTPPAEAFPDS